MTNSSETDLNLANDCQEVKPDLERNHNNWPGQPALRYRLGTQGVFLHHMLDRLAGKAVTDADGKTTYPLARLATRKSDDPTIALLDAWACTADVLTFYQERIANEGYLRTATERRSVLELARAIGYELRPGAAASAWLAFIVDEPRTASGDKTGAPEQVTIPKGTRIQSVPKPGDFPQTFETTDEFIASWQWNALKPRARFTEEFMPISGQQELYLKGANVQLAPGDFILIVGDERADDDSGSEQWDIRVVETVLPTPALGVTKVTWKEGLGDPQHTLPAKNNVKVYVFRQHASLFGHNAPAWSSLPEVVRIAIAGVPDLAPLIVTGSTNPYDPDEGWSILPSSDVEIASIKVTTDTQFEKPIYIPILSQDPQSEKVDDKYGIPPISIFESLPNDFSARIEIPINRIQSWASELESEGYEVNAVGYFTYFKLQVHWTAIEAKLPDALPPVFLPDWPVEEFKITSVAEKYIDLDTIYPKIVPGSWLALRRTGADDAELELYNVSNVQTVSRSDFTLVSKVTRVFLDTDEHLTEFGLRETSVLAQSEMLELADTPAGPISGSVIELEGKVSGLKKGHKLIIRGRRPRFRVVYAEESASISVGGKSIKSGEIIQLVSVIISPSGSSPVRMFRHPAGVTGVLNNLGQGTNVDDYLRPEPVDLREPEIGELVELGEDASSDSIHTTLKLKEQLKNAYDPAATVIYGNVVPATHGETTQEILGSGDASQGGQRFRLRKPPLTYVATDDERGAASALEVRVDELTWQEVPTLYGHNPDEPVYMLRQTDEGQTNVIFGDGVRGARLPTGVENVRATYRSGMGMEGEVEADKLTLLQNRPFGVKSVTNPLQADGAAPAEQRDHVRCNAPSKARTTGRIVSLKDYEDFALAFPGVGKAGLDQSDSGIITVYIAPADGAEELPSDLKDRLESAMEKARDPLHPTPVVDGYALVNFTVTAKLTIDPRLVPSSVEEKVKQRLCERYSFEQRELGQAVNPDEIIFVIHSVPGVVAASLIKLANLQETGTAGADEQLRPLLCGLNELLIIDPTKIELEDLDER